jgi:serine/threonine-protein kinase RsbW
MTVFSSTLDSAVEAVEDAETAACRSAQEAGFSESEQFFIGLAVREILVNAMKHGNGFDPSKKVGFQISLEGDELIVEVTDEGEGFDIESVPDPRLPENLARLSGRGIALARGIMDEFSVGRTSLGGARVRMVKRLRNQPRPPASHLITSID